MCLRSLLTLLLLLVSPFVMASEPLVSAEWLAKNYMKAGVVVVDLQSSKQYPRAHVPGAVNADYSQWRVTNEQSVRKVLPTKARLVELVNALGIDAEEHVVLTPIGAGAGDMAVATRIYWSLKVVGHKDVSILNGGLIGYADKGFPLATGVVDAKRSDYKPVFNESIIASKEDTLAAIQDSNIALVDTRSEGEYQGRRGGKGTIPTAVNLSYDRYIKPRTGYFKPASEITGLHEKLGVTTVEPQILFCNTAHRASLSWFVAYALNGNTSAKLYDGSMAEWAMDNQLPTVKP